MLGTGLWDMRSVECLATLVFGRLCLTFFAIFGHPPIGFTLVGAASGHLEMASCKRYLAGAGPTKT